MTSKEFQKVFNAAANGEGTLDESGSLEGLALHKKRVACTLGGAAAFLRYHCQLWSGEWDTAELSDFQRYYQRVTLLVGVKEADHV